MMRRSCSRLAAYGFVGLGQMGARMAPNLFANADVTELYVYDAGSEAMAQVAAASKGKVVVCQSPAEVAKAADTIVTMLPNGAIVRDVYTNAETGLFTTLRKGALLIDSSTVDPQTPRDLGKQAAELAGATLVDAPVSGGVNAAAAGSLTFMVGAADDAAFGRAKDALATMGKNIVQCGGIGAGQAVKLSNNMILAQHMLAVSEAMLLGTKLGVDPKVLAGVVNTSTGRCWSSELYNPFPGVCENAPASNGYGGGFGARLMLKDVGLALDAAESVGMKPEGAKNAKAEYAKMVESGLGDLDFSGIIKYVEGKK